nr:immunoglobulin light chain junction region [Macaca mulatta]MOW70316.1 immunoglobulin light chain junction region [Macaca mulatta]
DYYCQTWDSGIRVF